MVWSESSGFFFLEFVSTFREFGAVVFFVGGEGFVFA
jgi:hypothetical protein